MKYTSDREFLKSMNIKQDEFNHTHDSACLGDKPMSLDTCAQGYPLSQVSIDAQKPLDKIKGHKIIENESTGVPEVDAARLKLANEAAEKYSGKVGYVHMNGFFVAGVVVAMCVATDKLTHEHKVMLAVHTLENGEGVCEVKDFEIVDRMPQ